MELRGTKGSGFYPMIGISDIPISPPNEKKLAELENMEFLWWLGTDRLIGEFPSSQ